MTNILEIITWNLNGLQQHLHEVEVFLNTQKRGICLITETILLDPPTPKSMQHIPPSKLEEELHVILKKKPNTSTNRKLKPTKCALFNC